MSLFYSFDYNDVQEDVEDTRLRLRPTAVAELLDMHPNTVYRLLQKGQLPAQKLGGVWRICKKDLINFMHRYPH